MKTIKINSQKPELKKIKKAALVIKKDGIVAYPTDTCYGLGVNPQNKKVLQRLSRLKGRPKEKKFSLVFKDFGMIKKYCQVEPWQEKYLKKYLPGPYTLILKAKRDDGTIGVRIPDFKLTKMLSKTLGIPYTATSANKSGQLACHDVFCITSQLKDIDFILDAGRLSKTPPSKIVDLTTRPVRILRK